MGPRIREDTGGGGFLLAFSRGWDQCGDDGGDGLREWGPCNEILRLRCAALRMTNDEGMGRRMREDNGGEGERWVEARRDGGGNGRFANRPYQMVVRGNEGWVPASARTTGGGGFLPASSRGWDQCGDDGGDGLREWGPCNEILRLRCAALRMTWGVVGNDGGDGSRRDVMGGNGRFANRPYQMVVRGNEGWVPAFARTREGVDSWLRFHGGGTSAGMTEGMA